MQRHEINKYMKKCVKLVISKNLVLKESQFYYVKYVKVLHISLLGVFYIMKF